MGNKLNEVIASGKGRGRPKGKNPKGPYVPNGRPRGRPASDNPKKLTIRFTPDPIVQAVAKKSMTHNQSRPNSTVGLLK